MHALLGTSIPNCASHWRRTSYCTWHSDETDTSRLRGGLKCSISVYTRGNFSELYLNDVGAAGASGSCPYIHTEMGKKYDTMQPKNRVRIHPSLSASALCSRAGAICVNASICVRQGVQSCGAWIDPIRSFKTNQKHLFLSPHFTNLHRRSTSRRGDR